MFVTKNSVLAEEFALNIRNYLSHLEPRIGMCISQKFSFVSLGGFISENVSIISMLIVICFKFNVGEVNEVDQRHSLVGAIALYVLHFQLFRMIDKKLFRTFWDLYKKVHHLISNFQFSLRVIIVLAIFVCVFVSQVPGIWLIGNIIWYPNEFLYQKLPHMAKALDKKALNTVAQARLQWLQQKSQAL